MKVSINLLWIALIVLSVLGLFYIWFIGLPVPAYKAVTDDADSVTYTVQVAPYTFFDVQMSANEILTKTDRETFYQFKEGSIVKNTTAINANIVDVKHNVYGRPDGTLYRKFDTATLTVSSNLSMSQAYDALTNNETYIVPGYFQDLVLEEDIPAPTSKEETIYQKLDEGIFGMKDTKYDYNKGTYSIKWFGGDNRFYLTQRIHGALYENMQQVLAKAKACYGVTFEKYWMPGDYYLFDQDGYCIGIKIINANTQLIAITNSASQLDALLHTMEGSDLVGKEE